tara:strand:- start:4991 stop:5455 length:465 start_codon:yes stop_codon:yes gene_type:complete
MRIIIYSIIFLILSGCGFKIINQSENQKYRINEMEFKGERRINYFIKSKLLKKSNNEDVNNEITLIINTKKNKIIKEKNIKNEITKYEISLSSNIVAKLTENNTFKFSVTSNGDYSVSEQNSISINNEKKLIKILSQDLADKIVTELNLAINDL